MLSSYSVDNGPASIYAPDPTVTTSLYRQPFYESPPLPPGKHILNITNLGKQFWFDYVRVQIDAASPPGVGPANSRLPDSTLITTVTTRRDITTTTIVTEESSQHALPPGTSSQTSSISSLSSSLKQSTTSIADAIPWPPLSSINSSAIVSASVPDGSPLQTGLAWPSSSSTDPGPSDSLSSTVVGTVGDNHAHGPSIGLIAGPACAAGGLALASVPFLLWYVCRRRKRHVVSYHERHIGRHVPGACLSTRDCQNFLTDDIIDRLQCLVQQMGQKHQLHRRARSLSTSPSSQPRLVREAETRCHLVHCLLRSVTCRSTLQPPSTAQSSRARPTMPMATSQPCACSYPIPLSVL